MIAIAGDDESAKRTVAEFLDSIGYDAYDVGPLSEGWRYQPDTAAYGQPYATPGSDFQVPVSGHRGAAQGRAGRGSPLTGRVGPQVGPT